jgi:hypothetical protein
LADVGAALVGLALVGTSDGDGLESGAADRDDTTLGSGSRPAIPGECGIGGTGVGFRSPSPTE